MATLQTYIVTSSLPVVVDDAGKTTVYNPGDVFEELDSNVSVVRLLALGSIVPFIGQPVSGPMVISQGDPGPPGPTGPAGPGADNTASSAGGDVALSLAPIGDDLPFRGLSAGAGVTLTPSATDVTISATGEVNTSSNSGGDEGLALAKSGADLPFKGLTAGTGITLTPSATDVTIDAIVTTVPPPEDENNVLANQVFS